MEKNKKKPKIGIWGFGIVGKSALRHFTSQDYQIEILDYRTLEPSEKALIKKAHARFYDQGKIESFLKNNDKILASPGIDLRSYSRYQEKWITELDILQQHFKKPIVAITGTVGKTTITHMLSELLKNQGLKVWTGGNIGVGMLDLLQEKQPIDLAVLEASSFQLEQCKFFAPDLAIWTNFSGNHIDRHGSKKHYFKAKRKIIENQNEKQHAILPLSFFRELEEVGSRKAQYFFVGDDTCPSNKRGYKGVEFFTIKRAGVMRHNPHARFSPAPLITEYFQKLPKITFQENLLIISLALNAISKIMGKKLSACSIANVKIPPHRLEKVASINGVDFYNDSKSTTPAATIAAVKKLSCRPILLLLGGLSKGANRKKLIEKIKSEVKSVYAFGAEQKNIHEACKHHGLTCYSFCNLDSAVASCVKDAQPNSQVLLSPAGSSFDLFKNYQERGNHFKKTLDRLFAL